MILDFLNMLAFFAIFTGFWALTDFLRTRKERQRLIANGEKIPYPVLTDYARAFFPVFFIVLILRAFIIQPYRVPTGSLEPTVMPGDLVAVTQYNYGLRLPIWDNLLWTGYKPKRGEIALFRWPVNPSQAFVKRVIGLPGDRVSYINKVFYINGKKQPQTLIGDDTDREGYQPTAVKVYREHLGTITHKIWRRPSVAATDFKNVVVPPNHYLMVGDNRDNSDDGRSWGFVRRDQFLGRGWAVWMNIQFSPFNIQWHRIGTSLIPKSFVSKEMHHAKT